jgi:hypothetical protein
VPKGASVMPTHDETGNTNRLVYHIWTSHINDVLAALECQCPCPADKAVAFEEDRRPITLLVLGTQKLHA